MRIEHHGSSGSLTLRQREIDYPSGTRLYSVHSIYTCWMFINNCTLNLFPMAYLFPRCYQGGKVRLKTWRTQTNFRKKEKCERNTSKWKLQKSKVMTLMCDWLIWCFFFGGGWGGYLFHMVHIHGSEKTHKCDICGKTLYLKWRLNKHTSLHEESPKPCKYVKTGQTCPFDDVGCKFEHNVADTENDKEEAEEDQSPMDDELQNNFCSICEIGFRTQGELITHMGNKHLDLFPHIQPNNSLITF